MKKYGIVTALLLFSSLQSIDKPETPPQNVPCNKEERKSENEAWWLFLSRLAREAIIHYVTR